MNTGAVFANTAHQVDMYNNTLATLVCLRDKWSQLEGVPFEHEEEQGIRRESNLHIFWGFDGCCHRIFAR